MQRRKADQRLKRQTSKEEEKDKTSLKPSRTKKRAQTICMSLLILVSIVYLLNNESSLFSNVAKSITETETGGKDREEPTRIMLRQDSSNMDGQKKLKKQMLKLLERQEKGLDLGAKITTRWKGENAKYWESETAEAKPQKEKEKPSKPLESKKKEDDDTSNQSKEISPLPPDPIPPHGVTILKPTMGNHRETSNAIFTFAQGYTLDIYLSFIESLKSTGFDGDIVLSISADARPDVVEYLKSVENAVVYMNEWECINSKGEPVPNSREGQNHCRLLGLFGDDIYGKPLEDPRGYRPVATARYDLYYAWSLEYGASSWIFLLDFRDIVFQLDPVKFLPKVETEEDEVMYFFEEAVTIDTSSYNKRWLTTAYGKSIATDLSPHPILCSGSTVGTTHPIQIYLASMIQQFVETQCKLKGCDQGFHNYIYYTNQLSYWCKIEVVKQGKGLVNNLAALRDKPLVELGVLKDEKVLNWDGEMSPIVHQTDRDKDLNVIVKKKKSEFMRQWQERKDKQ